MLFKGISYLELWQPFCSAECDHMCKFCRGYYEEQFCEILLNFGKWIIGRCCLKCFYLKLWQPSCLVERNHLIICNFETGYHGEHPCELWNLDQWFRRCRFKTFLIWSSGASPFVQWTDTICAILKQASWETILWNCYKFGSVVQEEMLLKILIWSSGDPSVMWSRTIYAIFKEGIVENIHVKL